MPWWIALTLLINAWLGLMLWVQTQHQQCRKIRYRRRKRSPSPLRPGAQTQARRKPDWVRLVLVRLAAESPLAGCRTLASAFNRQYADHGICVGKTYVADTLKQHRYRAMRSRRRIGRTSAISCPIRAIWALDITEHRLDPIKPQPIVGLIDHGSRVLLSFEVLRDKSSITLLRILLTAIEHHGRPVALRTDNEAVFASRLFGFGLRWLGIRHQRTALHSPWQNGRIERVFGTLKPVLRLFELTDVAALQSALNALRSAYNHHRPHQALNGQTPAQVWQHQEFRDNIFRYRRR